MFQKQIECYVPDITQAEEIQKSVFRGFDKWSNVVNVENHIFLKVNWEFL